MEFLFDFELTLLLIAILLSPLFRHGDVSKVANYI